MRRHFPKAWRESLIGLVAATVVLAGCTPTPPLPGPTTPSLPAPGPGAHRIGVRVVGGEPEFYDRATGDRWVPRGFNHFQWTTLNGNLMDRTFRVVGNELAAAQNDLRAMGDLGYNAVRIWINACWGGATGCLPDPDGGLRREYLQNIAAYLQTAQENELYVMFTLDNVPEDGGYYSARNALCCSPWNGYNLDLLSGPIADDERFWQDFVTGLIDVGAPLDAIWAFELRNEQFFEGNQPPFGVLTTVQTVTGTYDLTKPAEVHAMRDEGLRYYADRLTAAIKSVDPTALVSMGFFPSSEGPNPTPPDPRLVDPRPLATSSLDFFDFHSYPGVGLDWGESWANSLLASVHQKPVVLGEFGAFRDAYPTAQDALAAMLDFQAHACADGLDGFLYWTWTGQGVYLETWGGDEAQLADTLSPHHLADPCNPGTISHPNLAFARPITASAFEIGPDGVYSPPKAFDLSEGTWWASGADAPQWIEVDLGGVQVRRVRLMTRQATEGPMQVTVRLLGSNGTELASHTLSQPLPTPVAELVFDHTFAQPVPGVSRARVETMRAGWVIWYDIAVFG